MKNASTDISAQLIALILGLLSAAVNERQRSISTETRHRDAHEQRMTRNAVYGMAIAAAKLAGWS